MTDDLFDAADTIGQKLNVKQEAAKIARESAQKNAIEKAQQLYSNSLQTIFNAMVQLPEKNGRKFKMSENFETNGVTVKLEYGHENPNWAVFFFSGENLGENEPVAIYFNSRADKQEKAMHDIKDAAAYFSDWINRELPNRILEIDAIAQAVKGKATFFRFNDPDTKVSTPIYLTYP